MHEKEIRDERGVNLCVRWGNISLKNAEWIVSKNAEIPVEKRVNPLQNADRNVCYMREWEMA